MADTRSPLNPGALAAIGVTARVRGV